MAVLEGDILIDENGNLVFKDGDIVAGNAALQHINAILNAAPGNFRKFPTLGANLGKEIDAPTDARKLERDISIALSLDGYQLIELDLEQTSEDSLRIDLINAIKVTDDTQSRI